MGYIAFDVTLRQRRMLVILTLQQGHPHAYKRKKQTYISKLKRVRSLRGRRLKGKGKGVLGKGVLGAREREGRARKEGGKGVPLLPPPSRVVSRPNSPSLSNACHAG